MSPSNNQKVKKKKDSQRGKDPKKERPQKVVVPDDFCPGKVINEMDYSFPLIWLNFSPLIPAKLAKVSDNTATKGVTTNIYFLTNILSFTVKVEILIRK